MWKKLRNLSIGRGKKLRNSLVGRGKKCLIFQSDAGKKSWITLTCPKKNHEFRYRSFKTSQNLSIGRRKKIAKFVKRMQGKNREFCQSVTRKSMKFTNCLLKKKKKNHEIRWLVAGEKSWISSICLEEKKKSKFVDRGIYRGIRQSVA